MTLAKLVAAYVLAVLLAEALAAVTSTQFVLHELASLGVGIPLGDRIAMTVYDIVGMVPLYGSVIAVAFLIALPVAGLLAKRAPAFRVWLFFAAGFTGIVCAISVIDLMLGIMPIAGARTLTGLIAQGIAGGIAASIFGLPVFQSFKR